MNFTFSAAEFVTPTGTIIGIVVVVAVILFIL